MYLRFSTAGSVDDGKSTLIGRLLHDTKALYPDQWEAVQKASQARGDEEVDLAFLTDGLKAEREQRITIDVAYRFFSTPARKFIIADTPGHEQYTRNMVTGASTSELAILLVDARKGLRPQTRRHAFISTLLGIPHLVVAINKMDLVDFQAEVFFQIHREFQAFATRLEVRDITYIPISALRGDNVVQTSQKMPWYGGATLLHHLETVHLGATRNVVDFRFPVQLVLRPHQDFRGYAGQVASGRVRPGHRLLVLPSGAETRVAKILTADGERDEAFAGESVVLCLEQEVEAGRGSLFVRPENLPYKASELDLTLCWLDSQPLEQGKNYLAFHHARWLKGQFGQVKYRVDINTMQRETCQALHLNEIGRVQWVSSEPMFFDAYRVNRATGSLILVDPDTNQTVAAAMIRGRARRLEDVAPARLEQRLTAVYPQAGSVTREQREARNQHAACVLWFTGLSGSGKTTLAKALEERLFHLGRQTMFLDGDNLRHGLCADLGFSASDRQQNIRRAAWTAQLAFHHGLVVVCSFISPFRQEREFARSLIPQGRFLEVFVSCDLEICKRRDPKGLYQRALKGEIPQFTGIASPYEVPLQPELVLETEILSVEQCLEKLLAILP